MYRKSKHTTTPSVKSITWSFSLKDLFQFRSCKYDVSEPMGIETDIQRHELPQKLKDWTEAKRPYTTIFFGRPFQRFRKTS